MTDEERGADWTPEARERLLRAIYPNHEDLERAVSVMVQRKFDKIIEDEYGER